MTSRMYLLAAVLWAVAALFQGYLAWQDVDEQRWAWVALYAGLALLWVGLAHKLV